MSPSIAEAIDVMNIKILKHWLCIFYKISDLLASCLHLLTNPDVSCSFQLNRNAALIL